MFSHLTDVLVVSAAPSLVSTILDLFVAECGRMLGTNGAELGFGLLGRRRLTSGAEYCCRESFGLSLSCSYQT